MSISAEQLSASMLSAVLRGTSSTAWNLPNPAAFTSRTISGFSAARVRVNPSRASPSVRSMGICRTVCPANSCESASRRSALRAMTHNSSNATCMAAVCANLRPIPLDAPVMMAILDMIQFFLRICLSKLDKFGKQYKPQNGSSSPPMLPKVSPTV